MKNVILFGASGFLGRHVRTQLAGRYRLTCPSRAECDLVAVDVAGLVRLLTRSDATAVVNCAGKVTGSSAELLRIHAAATGKLLEAIAATAPHVRLVRIGSAAEYGPVPASRPVRESDPAAPTSDYGVSHLAATRLAEVAVATGRADVVVLRVFNPVGPGLPESNLLGRARRLIRQAQEHGAQHVELGLLPHHRDFVDVRDVAAAVHCALAVADPPSRVINIGSGRAVSVREAITALGQVAGFDGEVRAGEIHPTAARSAGVPWICADTTRAAEHLGWHNTYDLTDSLKWLWTDGTR